MGNKGIEQIMSDKRTIVIITVIGVLTVGGIIVYQSGNDLSPLLLMGIFSSLVMSVVMIYFVLFYKK